MSSILVSTTVRATALRRWGVFAIFLVALAVRSYGLTYHSLWFDEVMSTFWAAKPAGEIWRVGLSLAQDKHPPLYYLALHGWTALFGSGDVAVRSFGAIIGALAVLPVYGIGKTLGGVRAGAFAALLVALNPFLVWYSQEARMFMPATTFALVGMYGVLRMAYCVSCIANWRQVLFAVCYLLFAICGFTAALYTYLFSAFLLPVAGAWVLLGWWLTRQEPGVGWRLGLGLGALAVVGLLFLPLARSAWLVSGGESTPGRAFGDMGAALWRMLQVYAIGWPQWPNRIIAALTIGAGVLAITGLVVPGRQQIANRKLQMADDNSQSATPALAPKRSAGASVCNLQFGGLFLALWFVLPLLFGGLLLARDRTVFAENALLHLPGSRALPGVGAGVSVALEQTARGGADPQRVGFRCDAGCIAGGLVAAEPARGVARGRGFRAVSRRSERRHCDPGRLRSSGLRALL